jgi:hypothetical protein
LFIFSEDVIRSDPVSTSRSTCTSRNTPDDSSHVVLRTTKDLRDKILEFGLAERTDSRLRPSPLCPEPGKDHWEPRQSNLERDNTLALFKIQKDNRTNDSYLDNLIRPGYSAKRYLSNWSKHWSPQLFETLFKEGKLCEETLYEPNEILPNIKHR